ncbi:MAG: hypothetical protein AAFX90_21420 [Pseudomonadota bacterium]
MQVHHSSIANLLSRLGFTYLKKSLATAERRRAKVRRQRTDWFKHRLPTIAALPDRVVFIDETAMKTNLTRLRGTAKRGRCLKMDAPFGSWGTQTLIAGLTSDALIAPWVIKGAMDGSAFCRLHPRSPYQGDSARHCRNTRQSGNTPHQGSRTGLARSWLLVPLPATILSGLKSNRASLLETESAPPPHQSEDIHQRLPSHRLNL